MDAHNAHTAPLPAGGGQGQVGPVGPQAGQVGQKAEEPLGPRPLKAACQLRQSQQVGLAGLPLVHGTKDPQQVGAVVDAPDQLMAAPVPRLKAQLGQLGQEGPAVLPRVGTQRIVEVRPRGTGADLGQPVGGKAVHRGAQHRDEGHVLPGVVRHL